ncbi:MAG: LamG-like jellyroll fold domain-containing protein [Kiritimatiellales bacterium]
MQFRAGVANAGAAIEISKSAGCDAYYRTTPWLRDVKITREQTSTYFTYGFKAAGVTRPMFTAVDVIGTCPGMRAGILCTNFYNYHASRCFFSGADVAIDAVEGGEGNNAMYTTITNVNIGIRMAKSTHVSSSGGDFLYNNISARQIGVSIDHKSFSVINNNVFSRSGGTGSYANVYLNDIKYATISDNIFVGGTGQYGIVLAEDRAPGNYINQNTIAYNTFSGPFVAGISIGTNVLLTKVIDNINIQTGIVDKGTDTYIASGSPRAAFNSPASVSVNEEFGWNSITNSSGPVFDVTKYKATGDGTTDDTAAITNAVAALKASLDNTGYGTLYFPAGRYIVTNTIKLAQQNGKIWQKMAICGDGAQVSVIVATTTNGIFKITCTGQVQTRIHNIRMSPGKLNSGSAIELTQQGGAVNGSRSLIMHDVLIAGSNTGYFTTGFRGQGLVRPLFQSVWMYLRGGDGCIGMKLAGGYGFDWQDGRIGLRADADSIGKACEIDSLGGAVIVRGFGFCSGGISTGLTVNAGGGIFALSCAHINALNNLVVSNASEASFLNTETLWSDLPDNGVLSSSLRFSNCKNIYVRDNILSVAGPYDHPNHRFVLLNGGGSTNVDFSGNFFHSVEGKEEGVGFYISQGNTHVSVYDNRFVNNLLFDILCYEPTAKIEMLPMETRPELAGYWNLEDGSGSTAYGRCYVQNGAISGAKWVAGKYHATPTPGDGYGLKFDGIDDTVTMATPQFKEVMRNFTMMAWVRPDKAISGGNRSPTQSYVFTLLNGDEFFPNGVTNIHRGVALSVGTNEIRVVEHGTLASGLDTQSKITLAASLSSTAWTHVAVTYSNCVPRLYTNGVLAATGTASTGKIPHPGCNFGGNFSWGPYKGSMDEMRVLNRALSESEITAEMTKSDI